MNDDKKIIKILSELLIETQGSRIEMQGMRAENRDIKTDIIEIKIGMAQMYDDFKNRLDRSDEIQSSHALAIRELRLSIMRLADAVEKYTAYEERLKKLESVVFRQAS